MPFPAVPLPVSFAIGIPVALGLFVAQEMLLQRRAARRAHGSEAGAGRGVTATPPISPAGEMPGDAGPAAAPPVATPARARKQPARGATAARPTPAAEPRTVATATPVEVSAAPPGAPPPAPPRRAPTDPRLALHKRQAALNTGLEAIIDFVDGAARRKRAVACAEALQDAVPKRLRGPALEAFVAAAQTDAAPSQLQELAEDAGVEVATAIKQVNAEIRALPAT